jgi:tryptophan synthase alpha chain
VAGTTSATGVATGDSANVESGVARIEAAFARARDEGRAALLPYLVGGFPDAETSLAVARSYVDAGADLVELGIPYSDPVAEGPVIHAAASRALSAGATLTGVLDLCTAIADDIPVLVMCYANEALGSGPRREAAELMREGAIEFADAIAAAGAAGAIIPDLPVDHGTALAGELERRGLASVPLVAPTTAPDRRRAICSAANGFVYVVSLTGVTGERAELPAELAALVEAVREEARVPAAVGFGIGTPEQAASVGKIADGVIIGSRLVREVDEAADAAEASARVGAFLREARAALARSR